MLIEKIDVGAVRSAGHAGRPVGRRSAELRGKLKAFLDAGDTLCFIEPTEDEMENPQLFRARLRRAASDIGVGVNVRGGNVGEFVLLREER